MEAVLSENNKNKFKFLSEKISGNTSEGKGCSVFSQKVTLPDGTSGLFAACLLVKEGEDISGVANDFFGLGVAALEEFEGDGVLDSFKKVFGKVEGYLAEKKVEVNFVFTFFYNEVGYLLRRGHDVSVWIYDNQSPGSEISIHAGSGILKNGQVYLIASKSCFELFDLSVLSEEGADITEVIDGMATEISTNTNSNDIGAVIVKVAQEDTFEDLAFEEEEREEKSDTVSAEEVTVVEETKEEVPESDKKQAVLNNDSEGITVREEEVAYVDAAVAEEGRGKISLLSGVAGFGAKTLREISGVFKGEKGAISSFRKKLIVSVVVLFVVIVASVSFNTWQNFNKQKDTEFQSYYSVASEKYKEGVAVIEVNRQKARQLFIDAQKEIEKALAIKKNDETAIRLASDINDKLKETEIAAGIKLEKVAEITEEIGSISISGRDLVVASEDNAYRISNGEASRVLSDLGGARSSVVFDSRLFWESGDGVFRQGLTGGDKAEVSGARKAYDIGVFFGNVYLLTSSQVLKIVPVEGGYAEPVDYLQDEQNFSESSRMAIDTLIWVTSGDKVLKFNRGAQEPFEILGLTSSLGKLGPIYTDGSLDNLYVIDKENSVLLVIDKDGNYKKAIQSPDFFKATDIVVNETEDTFYVAAGSEVLSASLE